MKTQPESPAGELAVRPMVAADVPALLAPGTAPAYLIRSHGLYAWGKDLAEAERVLEGTEWLIAAELAERAWKR